MLHVQHGQSHQPFRGLDWKEIRFMSLILTTWTGNQKNLCFGWCPQSRPLSCVHSALLATSWERNCAAILPNLLRSSYPSVKHIRNSTRRANLNLIHFISISASTVINSNAIQDIRNWIASSQVKQILTSTKGSGKQRPIWECLTRFISLSNHLSGETTHPSIQTPEKTMKKEHQNDSLFV